MNQPLYFEDLAVGNRWRSRARTVTETDVVNFAGLTGDYDQLHVDHEFAKQTPYGRPIAHGLLGLSLVAGLGSCHPSVHTVAFVAVRSWEFLLPIYFGDTVRAVNEVIELRESGRRRGTVLWKRQLVNQRNEVLQQGIFETLVARSGGTSARETTVQATTTPVAKTNRRVRADAAGTNHKSHVPKKKTSTRKLKQSAAEAHVSPDPTKLAAEQVAGHATL